MSLSFETLFEHCHWENPVFRHGMFWLTFLAIFYVGTLYYKHKESKEAQQAEDQKLADAAAKQKKASEPRLIQPLARPVEKKIDVPVVEVASKPKKLPKDAPLKKPQPVEMVLQTPTAVTSNGKKAKKEESRQDQPKSRSADMEGFTKVDVPAAKKKSRKSKKQAAAAAKEDEPTVVEVPIIEKRPTTEEQPTQRKRAAQDDGDWNVVV